MTHRWLCLVAHLLIGCLFWPYHYCPVLSVIWRAYFPLVSSPVLSGIHTPLHVSSLPAFL